LIDGGPDASGNKKLGEFLPYGDREIELAILTHPHADHVAGFNEIMQNYQIKKIMMTGVLHTAPDYLDFLARIRDQKINTEMVTGPEKVYLPGADANSTSSAYLEILTPEKSLVGERMDNLNNSSIVAKLVYGSTTMMLTGDMEEEEKMLDRGLDLKADVLKVGHHGSTNANSWEFLTAVNPKYAAISVGKDNQFGHPHFRTLHYLDKLGSRILRTDLDGDIVFVSDGRNFSLVK
jgi:beta-lactamase superfamily II metal-dependent hydrolase